MSINIEQERLKNDQMCCRHECLRRAIEAGSHSIRLLMDARKNENKFVGVISDLENTIKQANTKLQKELTELK